MQKVLIVVIVLVSLIAVVLILNNKLATKIEDKAIANSYTSTQPSITPVVNSNEALVTDQKVILDNKRM